MSMNTRKSSLPGGLVTAAVLATGFGTVWFALAAWLGTSVFEASWAKVRLPREMLVVALDGEPLIMSQPMDDLSQTTYRDLNGVSRDGDELRQLPSTPIYGEGSFAGPPTTSSRPTWPDRVKVFRNESKPAELWYFVHDGEPDGSGVFVGYERVSNRRIGHIGLAGFREGPPPPEERIPVSGRAVMGYAYWSSLPILAAYPRSLDRYRTFPGDLSPDLVHVPSGNALRVVDLGTRKVATVFEASEPIVAVGVPAIGMYNGGSKADWERPVLVRTASRIHKLDHRYKHLGAFDVPGDVPPGTLLSWYETKDGRSTVVAVRAATDQGIFGVAERDERIDRLSPDGGIQETLDVALKTGIERREGWQESAVIALALPTPAPMAAVGWLTLGPAAAPGRAAQMRRLLPALAAVLAFAFLLAAAAWRRGRGFGLSGRERAAWAAFVLSFGLPAFVGFLLHRSWPARVPCPRCRARSPRDRDACLECGAPFPAPALLGTEIFA
ncbi:hypothetical protein [Planctomyces sp. SH-PL62]|uniref:hypothetical protein n=1 Tax=Planctomyces sp. SH-PL62 TaxID=1636152 RepID=UPI00078E3AFC|nr:hypothetical protein [Planctomyces sp. SH-PL62]AMV40760.1 hypothetical protein VT85_25230 [Planctomyces sp. SH-PL62]